ncbi:neuroblast differentiation-associated protein AHNAK isoform X11 [Etheostoma cragini]|uniref:neuroblast differentiation-associated protein AHNAK isoform X11 n=1 Tax=Etheostoma cragini TaxID=417921 RepID=UPI00155E182E|nr:neuroblast differentiation-associated protein AHNAK isoform X11 [Etheostoma cragini]
MCECLRGIFRVTWTPSSNTDSDRDQEDSHVYSQTRDPAVKDKRRSPPSSRSPSAPQRNPHHSGSTDEQESPERVVQKEKLHAELKQVLSQKRSHLRESTCQLAQPEMDSEPTDKQTCVEDTSQSVEIVVEAEAGASGYSVTGGGQRGIFVKDVLKDSPAAKHLSLQEGDQLLSAKVYFDNVKYEDALKILQCAEPYKVSFQLKRSIPGVEVCLRPRVPSVEVKGPKAKTAKMSVKGSKVFKAKKKRGGRFGLKRLKEKRREEMVIEGTPPMMEMSDVDVEFSLPKFKQKRSMKVEAEGARGAEAVGKAKRRIRFPHLKTKGYTEEDAGGKVETGQLEGQLNISSPAIPGAKVKTKGKGNKFGITFPRTKHTKSSLASETGSVELKPPSVTIQQPSVEFNLSGDKKVDVEKGGVKRNAPDVEFALPSGKAEASLPAVKGKAEIKVPKIDIKGGVDAGAAVGRADVDIGKGDTKLRMPKLKLPKVRLSRHSDEIDGDIKVKAKGMKVPHANIIPSKVEIKGGGEINLPEANITKPKMEGDPIQMPSVDISLPKVKGKSDMDVSLPEYEGAGKTAIKMPAIDISVPDVDFKLDTKHRIPDEVEGKISMPKIDMSLPKMGSSNVDIEGLEGGGKYSLPSVDISPPKVKTEVGDVDMHYYVGGDGKFKMPEFDISLPKCMPLEGDVNIKGEGFKLPKVDLTLPKDKAGTTDIEGVEKFQLPSFDISLPKIKTGEVVVGIEGPEVKGGEMPTLDISLPKGKIEVPDVEMEGGTGGKFKLPHWKMPDFYISLPKGKIEGPDTEIEGGTGGKFKMPKVDISLPKRKPSVEGPELDIGGHFKMPNVGISIPKGKESIDIPEEKMASDGGTIQLPHVNVPKVDISLPKGKSKAIEATAIEMEVTGGKFVGPHIKLPKEGVSVLKNKSGEGEINLSTAEAGGKVKVPQVPSLDLDIDVRLDKPKQDTEAHGEADLHVKGEHKALKLKMPTIDIKGPKGDLELDIGLNRGEGNKDRKKIELPDLDLNTTGTNSKVKGSKVKGTKFKIGMPKKKTGRDVTAEAKICKNCGDEEIGGKTKHRCMGKERFEYDVKLETHNGHKENKDRINIPVPEVTLPTKQGSAELGTGGEGSLSSSRGDSKVPRIPDIEFDITTSPDKYEDTTEKGKKIKIPKFGVALPSMSSPEGKINIFGPEIQYEGPKMPKVKKAVFVLVNPPQTGDHAACTGLQEKETTPGAEKEDVKVKMPKIKMKPSFGKPKDNAAALSFSPCKSGSFDVNLRGKGSTSSLNAEKDACPLKSSNGAKGTSSGKIKFPKVELTSPYGKMAAEGEDTEMSLKLGKDSSPGEVEGDTKGLQVQSGKMAVAGFSEELSKDVVSSRARTDMLDRDSSESPASFTMEFSSAKVQSWSKVESHSRESEERESSPWFKVPKFTLKPHSTGFLQITPEGSPQAQRKGEVGGEADVLGSFCLHTSGLDFTTQDVSEENQVCSTEDGTVTMVTKTTRITRHMVTSEAQTGESSATTTTTHQVSDFKH